MESSDFFKDTSIILEGMNSDCTLQALTLIKLVSPMEHMSSRLDSKDEACASSLLSSLEDMFSV